MKVLLFVTVVFSGLMAGLFYSYSCSVNMGLRPLPNTAYLKAMQSINQAIQNPAFLLPFIVLLVMYPVAVYRLYQLPLDASFYMLVLAMLLYVIGVFGVTVCCNVPLNEQLDRFSVDASLPDEIAAMRNRFEQPWNSYHSIRMYAAVCSFALSVLVIIKQKIQS